MEALFLKMQRLLDHRSLEKEVSVLRSTAAATVIGRSELFRRVLETIRAAAPSDVSVLLLGESGTGKRCWRRCCTS